MDYSKTSNFVHTKTLPEESVHHDTVHPNVVDPNVVPDKLTNSSENTERYRWYVSDDEDE